MKHFYLPNILHNQEPERIIFHNIINHNPCDKHNLSLTKQRIHVT